MPLNYVESTASPVCCEGCNEPDCYNCDHAGDRWIISRRKELILKKELKYKAILRLQREIREINVQLIKLPRGETNEGV